MFRLKSHRQAKLRTMKFFTMWLRAFGMPDDSAICFYYIVVLTGININLLAQELFF